MFLGAGCPPLGEKNRVCELPAKLDDLILVNIWLFPLSFIQVLIHNND